MSRLNRNKLGNTGAKGDATGKAAGKAVRQGVDDGGPEAAPATMTAARQGGADDLKADLGRRSQKMETMLHSMGFFHFDQVAAWTDENLAGSIAGSKASRVAPGATTGSARRRSWPAAGVPANKAGDRLDK